MTNTQSTFARHAASATRRSDLLLRSDRPLSHVVQVPCDRDGLVVRQHEPRSLEQHFMLRTSNFGLKDLNGQVTLLPTH
jgi:hypothetical protein